MRKVKNAVSSFFAGIEANVYTRALFYVGVTVALFFGMRYLGDYVVSSFAWLLPGALQVVVRNAIAQIVVILAIAGMLRWKSKRSLRSVGFFFSSGWLGRVGEGFTIGTLMLILAVLPMYLIGAYRFVGVSSQGLRNLVFGLVTYITVAVTEELLARGYIMHVLRPFSRAGAVLLSSFLFTALHGMDVVFSPHVFAEMFLSATVFALMYLATGDLWTSIGAHFAWDFVLDSVLGIPAMNLPQPTGLLMTEMVTPSAGLTFALGARYFNYFVLIAFCVYCILMAYRRKSTRIFDSWKTSGDNARSNTAFYQDYFR